MRSFVSSCCYIFLLTLVRTRSLSGDAATDASLTIQIKFVSRLLLKAILTHRCRNAPASVSTGAQYSFNLGTSSWSFTGSSPCPGGVSTCYNVDPVTISADNGASASSSSSWSGSSSRVLSISATISNRLGPVTVTYTVVVYQYQETTLSQQVNYQDYYYCHYSYDEDWNPIYGRHPNCGCCETLCCTTQYYQARVHSATSSMSASASLLLLPTGVTVHSQPASSYTAASTTNVVVTLQLAPAVTVTSGHPFTAEMTSVSESGALLRLNLYSLIFTSTSGVSIGNIEGGSSANPRFIFCAPCFEHSTLTLLQAPHSAATRKLLWQLE
jgi:hypothetical protein